MPRMTYVKSIFGDEWIHVREGSMPTKSAQVQWDAMKRWLSDIDYMVYRLFEGFLKHRSELRRDYGGRELIDDYAVEDVIEQMEGLHKWLGELLQRHSTRSGLERRIALLENNAGRTPEETAAYRTKAAELKQRLDRDDGRVTS